MHEITGNFWSKEFEGYWKCITINGQVNHGKLVMGKGIALDCKKIYPGIDSIFASMIKFRGFRTLAYPPKSLFLFPTKRHWREDSSLKLIRKSTEELKELVDNMPGNMKILLPRVGCGNGNLAWEDVKPILKDLLDEQFYVINQE